MKYDKVAVEMCLIHLHVERVKSLDVVFVGTRSLSYRNGASDCRQTHRVMIYYVLFAHF